MTAIQILQTLSSNELEIISSICIDSLSSLELTSGDGSIERFLTLNSAVGKIRAACELSKREISTIPSPAYNFDSTKKPVIQTETTVSKPVSGPAPTKEELESIDTSNIKETTRIIK